MMFGFIRKTVSALTWPVRTAATYLLQNAVKKDRRWAIKPLIWLGADCNATYKNIHNDTTLSFAIRNNKPLALELLDIPAIQQQIKDDATYKALITVTSCLVSEGDDTIDKNLSIQQKLLELKHISAAAAESALEQHEIYGIDTAREILINIREEKLLHESNNLILNTAIKLALHTGIEWFKSIAIALLEDDKVQAQLKKDIMPENQDFNEQAVTRYLKRSGIFCEFLDKSWIVKEFAQNLGKATVVAPRMLTGHERYIEDQKTAYNVLSKQPEPTKPAHMHDEEEEELTNIETNGNNNGFQSPNSHSSRTPDSQGSQSPKYGVVSL